MDSALDIARRYLAERRYAAAEGEGKEEKEGKGAAEGGFPCLSPFPSPATSEIAPADDGAIPTPTDCPECWSELAALTCPACGWRLCDHCRIRRTASAADEFCEACGPPESAALTAWNQSCRDAAAKQCSR